MSKKLSTPGFVAGSSTSQAAAESMIRPSEAQRRRIVVRLREVGNEGRTSYEARIELGLKHQSASARMSEMNDPHAEYHQTRMDGRKRKTDSGRPAMVYVLERRKAPRNGTWVTPQTPARKRNRHRHD